MGSLCLRALAIDQPVVVDGVLGLLDVQAESVAELDLPETSFGVVRVKRNLGRRSTVGAIFTRRDESEGQTRECEVIVKFTYLFRH